MINGIRILFTKWTPWEKKVLSVFLDALGSKHREIVKIQLDKVNKIQRIVEWREIDFYVMRRGKVNRAGLPTLFDDRDFDIATIYTRVNESLIRTRIGCTQGFVFSLESDSEIKPIAFRKDLDISLRDIDKRFR